MSHEGSAWIDNSERTLTSDPHSPVATTLMRTCLRDGSSGTGLSSNEKDFDGLSTKDRFVSTLSLLAGV